MDVSADYPIDRLTAVLEMASAGVASVGGGYASFIRVPTDILTDDDKILATEHLVGVLENGEIIISMKGNDGSVIVFVNEDDALETAKSQIPHLSKKLLFSIYKKTGVSFSMGTQPSVSEFIPGVR